MPSGIYPLNWILLITALLSAMPCAIAMAKTADIPVWLQAHVGAGEGQIAPVVLQRARALYREKVSKGAVKNPCYFAMDATRPSVSNKGQLASRFYIICEDRHSFQSISSGYGAGRQLQGIADFKNDRTCAKHFSNADGSKLTSGGRYLTAETKTSFKGYARISGKTEPFLRSFLQFEGEGDTANARKRLIGGHQAAVLHWSCRLKDQKSPYADKGGYVPFGKLAYYAAGRSSGCTTWSPENAKQILAMTKNRPTTLYIYPESADINAVAKAVKAGKSLSSAGLYWNASCLKTIHSPTFWPKEKLEPIINKYKEDHAPPPGWRPKPLPVCR